MIHLRKYLLFLLFLCVTLALNAQVKKYYGAEIRTNESFLYGRFEVKMKSCEASGMLISFFTFYDSPDFASNWNEIDVEILGRYPNEVQFNAIVGKHQMHEHRQVLNFNPHSGLHTYSFDWTPEYIAWSVDGQEVHRQTGEHIAQMNKAQKIMMNIWPSQFWDWTGPWQEDKLPLHAIYDYVKYYKYNPKASEKFELEWEDNFDKIDYSRWAFATHTFDGNACQFDPSNGRAKDGQLILSLTKTEFDPVEEPTVDETKKEVSVFSAEIVDKNTIKVTFSTPVNRVNARKENFVIEGVEIQKAKFAMDMKTVVLSTSDVDIAKNDTITFTPPDKKEGASAQKIKLTKP